jgi:hypothetical protein
MEENFNVWIGLRASDYQVFTDVVQIDQIVSIDSDDTKGIPLISKELVTKRREPWSNDELLTLADLAEFQALCARFSTLETPVNIYCYHSFLALEEQAHKYEHVTVRSSSMELRDHLDDKLQFMELLHTLNLPKILSFSNTINNLDFDEIKAKVGLPLVIKLKVGASGGQTYFVSSSEDFRTLQQTLKNETVIVSTYISGPSFNINGFIGTENVYLDQPSLQLIGIPECASGKFTYCGNDFPSFNKYYRDVAKEIKKVTERIGWYIKEQGYYGVFGVDFIYNLKDSVLYPLEINPRMQGSTALLARYQFTKKFPRLAELYITETQTFHTAETVEASFILLHNLSNERLTIEHSFASGLYTFAFSKGKLKLTYLGYEGVFPTHKSELLIVGCPPQGTFIEPGAGIMRIEFSSAILKKNGRHLKKLYAKIAHDMYNILWE